MFELFKKNDQVGFLEKLVKDADLQIGYLQSKCERLNAEVIGVMKENDRLKQQLANAGFNDGGTCNATGPVMTDQKHTEAYQKHILGMFGNG